MQQKRAPEKNTPLTRLSVGQRVWGYNFLDLLRVFCLCLASCTPDSPGLSGYGQTHSPLVCYSNNFRLNTLPEPDKPYIAPEVPET